MTTTFNPISPQTLERASLQTPEPASRTKTGETDRFRESLDRRVRGEESSRGDRDERTTGSRERDRGAQSDAQETRRGADDAERNAERASASETRETARRDDAPSEQDTDTKGSDARGEADADAPDTSKTNGAENAVATAQQASVRISPTTRASDQQAPGDATGQAKAKNGANPTRASLQANASGETQSQQSGEGKQTAPTRPTIASVTPQQADNGQARPSEDALDSAGVRAFGVDGGSNTRASGQAGSQANGSSQSVGAAVGASLQQQTGGGETSTGGDDSSSRRDTGPALKLAIPEVKPGGQAAQPSGFSLEPVSNGPAARGVTEASGAARQPTLQVTNAGAETAQNERAVASSVSRGLAAAVQQRGGSLTIRLSPESLGHVRVDLEMSQGRVNAALHASTERAQEAMVKSITMLRSSLESKGLTVERLTVQLAPTQTNTNTQTGGDQTSQDGSRNQSNADRDASDGQSRGRDGQRHGGHGRNGFAFDERFEEAFGLEPDDPRAQTLRLRLSAIG